MRKINFRARDKQLKRWTYALHVNGNGTIRVYPDGYPNDYICLEDSDRFEVVEFTGLQDVTSKDIYEGDIVDVDIPFKNNAIMIVKKYLSEMLLSFNLDEEDTDCMFRFKDVGELKIIGNIYENPELLEQGRETLNEKSF